MVTGSITVQPVLSLTVTLYVPADNPLTLDVVAPLLHEYVYGGFPAVAVT